MSFLEGESRKHIQLSFRNCLEKGCHFSWIIELEYVHRKANSLIVIVYCQLVIHTITIQCFGNTGGNIIQNKENFEGQG